MFTALLPRNSCQPWGRLPACHAPIESLTISKILAVVTRIHARFFAPIAMDRWEEGSARNDSRNANQQVHTRANTNMNISAVEIHNPFSGKTLQIRCRKLFANISALTAAGWAYASGVTPNTTSNCAANSPIFDDWIGAKSTVTESRIFSSRMLRQMPSRSLPG